MKTIIDLCDLCGASIKGRPLFESMTCACDNTEWRDFGQWHLSQVHHIQPSLRVTSWKSRTHYIKAVYFFIQRFGSCLALYFSNIGSKDIRGIFTNWLLFNKWSIYGVRLFTVNSFTCFKSYGSMGVLKCILNFSL